MPGAKGKSGGARKGSGRPAFEPTAAHCLTVEKLAACGTSQAEIARCMDMSVPTLMKHFADEVLHGRERVMTQIAQGLLARALKGDNTAAIFALKSRWKEAWSERQEITGKDGIPIEAKTAIVDEAQIKAAISKLEGDY